MAPSASPSFALPDMSRVSAVMRGLHVSPVRLAIARVDHAARRVALRTMINAADALAIECLHDGAIDQASESFRTAYRQAVDFAGVVATRRALVDAEALQDMLTLAGGATADQVPPASIALRRAMGSGGSSTLSALL